MEGYFSVYDYIILTVVLFGTIAVGIYQSVRKNRIENLQDFLSAGRKLSAVPAAISAVVSYLSAISVLGYVTEGYLYGTLFATSLPGSALGYLVAILWIIPVLYKTKITSINEYLLQRFHYEPLVRLVSFITILQQLLYCGVVIFAPSIAMQAVTGIPIVVSIIGTGLVATILTTIGGLRAVIWTDVVQFAVILAGLLSTITIGTFKVGSFSKIWNINHDKGRLIWYDWSLDPRERMNTLSLTLASFLESIYTLSFRQITVQRYISTPNLSTARKSMAIYAVTYVTLLKPILTINGLVVFAYYVNRGCNPLAGDISNVNQLCPYFVMNTLNYPCVPGIFLAVMYCAAVTTVSSILNVLSTLTWQDFLLPFCRVTNERTKLTITRTLVIIYAVLAVAVSFLAQHIGEHVLWLTLKLLNTPAGPIMAVFLLGIIFKRSHGKAVFVGCIFGISLMVWITTGSILYPQKPQYQPLLEHNCSQDSFNNLNESLIDGGLIDEISNSTTLRKTNPEENIYTKFLQNIAIMV